MSVRVHFLCFYIQKRRIIRPSAKLTESQRSLPRDWSTTWLHPNLFLFRTIPSLLSYSSLSRSYYEIALRLFSSASSTNEIPAISSSVSSTEIHHDRPASSRASASFPPSHFPTPGFVMVFALHRSRRIAIGYEVIDKNLSNNSTDLQARQWD